MTSDQRDGGINLRNHIVSQQAKAYFDANVKDGSVALMRYDINIPGWLLSVSYDNGETTSGIDIHITDFDSQLTIESFERSVFEPASVLLRGAM